MNTSVSVFRGNRLFRGIIMIGLLVMLSTVLKEQVASQDMATTAQEYTVYYGGFGPGNVAIYAFTPNDLKIHRGDTVTWVLDAESNVHFGENERTSLFVSAEVNGETMSIFNPAAAYPTIESGAVYSGGDVTSGTMGLISMDQGTKTFSLVMDLEPGTYAYFCDVHVRTGTITVIPDDEPIPSPAEVAMMTGDKMETMMEEGATAYSNMLLDMAANPDATENRITVGLRVGDEGVYVRQFFPAVIVIEAGESVTWEVPAGNADSHTITWPPIELGQLIVPFDMDADPPIYALGPTLISQTETDSTITQGQHFHAIIGNGGIFTLTFTEPGAYPYVDNLHAPGMDGVVVVLPAD